MEETVSDTPSAPPWRHYRAMLVRHRQLAFIILGSCLLAAGVYTALQTPLYMAATSVLIENRNQRIVGDVEIGVWMDQEEAKAQRILAKSRPVLERAARRICDEGLRPGKAPNEVRGEYNSVDATAQGRLLILQVVHPSPESAAELANAWNHAFVEESKERQRSSSIYTRDFLAEELPALRKAWVEKQEALQRFIVEENFDQRVLAENPVYKRHAELYQRVKESDEQLKRLQAEAKEWEDYRNDVKYLMQSKRADQNRSLVALRIQIQEQERRLIERRIAYAPNSEEVRNVQDVLAALETSAKKCLEDSRNQLAFDLRAAEDSLRILTQLYNESDKEYKLLQDKENKYKPLAFEVKIAEREYEEKAQRQREAALAGKVELSFAQTWEKAEVPDTAILPSWRRNMTMGFIMGLVLACIAVYLREFLDDTVRSSEQLEKRLGVSVLGAIPLVEPHWLKEGGYALVKEHPRAVPVESLRSLRSSLTLSYGGNGNGAGHGVMLLVTSPGEGEGKSFLSSNLAVLFATAGKRILLVDMDLHKASLTRHYQLLEEPGLMSLASGSPALDSLIKTTATPNLFFLPSGKPGSAPAAIIESAAFASLLLDARHKYDVVLLDAPPILAVADASSVASKCDATLIAVRSRSTRLTLVDRAIEMLQRAQAKECICVLNGLDASDAEAGGYGYGSYYYQGGYSYGRRHPNESALLSKVEAPK